MKVSAKLLCAFKIAQKCLAKDMESNPSSPWGKLCNKKRKDPAFLTKARSEGRGTQLSLLLVSVIADRRPRFCDDGWTKMLKTRHRPSDGLQQDTMDSG